MKKIATIMAFMLALTLLAGCASKGGEQPVDDGSAPESTVVEESAESSEEKVSEDEEEASEVEPAESAAEELSSSQSEDQAAADWESYQVLVVNLVEQYRNNTVEVSEAFPALPEGFELPELEELSEPEFVQDETGNITTAIMDKGGVYEMWISIDDTMFDGVRPEGNPRIDSVMFNKVA